MSPSVSGTIGAGGIGYAVAIVLFDWILPAAHCPLPAPENMADVQSAVTAILTATAAFIVHRIPPPAIQVYKMIRLTLAVLSAAIIALALSACVQVQPCPPNSSCHTSVYVTTTTNIMATVPVSALPGLP